MMGADNAGIWFIPLQFFYGLVGFNFRFDPVTNVWEYVGDLPEPRHHHSVAFLRGRVYLVGEKHLPYIYS